MRKSLNIAIIGGGGFMGQAHSAAFSLVPALFPAGVDLVRHTLVDVDETLATDAAHRYGWHNSSTDWHSVVTHEDIDVVDIVTPPPFHLEIAQTALSAGKAVFCEKPIANTLEDAELMAASVKRFASTAQVGFNYRFTPALLHLKELIKSGALGEILTTRATLLQDGHFLTDDFGWRATKESGGSGAIGDLGSHLIDLALHLVGDIDSVVGTFGANYARAGEPWADPSTVNLDDATDDAASWLVRYGSGAIGTFDVSFQASGHKNELTFQVDGTKGSAIFDWNDREVLQVSFTDAAPDASGFTRIVMSDVHPHIWYPVAGIGIGYIEGSAIQFSRFFNAVAAGTTADPDFDQAVRVQQVIDAVYSSIKTQRWANVYHR